MADERSVVWVLGAGFSKGLGGPLLPELFTDNSAEEIRIRYKQYDALFDATANAVRWLYKYGSGGKPVPMAEGGKGCEALWSNAEEFIDYLDTAADEELEAAKYKSTTPGPRCIRIVQIIAQCGPTRPNPAELRDAARFLIAAECSAFLVGSNERGERWKAFHRWARQLGPKDTVITFNYDCVLEKLRAEHNSDATRSVIGTASALTIVIPSPPSDKKILQGACRVLKLHGSVNWRKVNGSLITEDNPEISLWCKPEELAIATPGPTKLSESEGFKALWDLACEALRLADSIACGTHRSWSEGPAF